ncbi:MAG: type II secretion system GspH family protein [Turicibacter sp.]|nr:type II secretion system GspH family protein [Turicibacter sp.]
MGNNLGFTLTEALVSLIITGILISFSLPSMSRFYDHFQLMQALSVLQSDLHRVRDYNMVPLQQGGGKDLIINHDDQSYTVTRNGVLIAKRRLPDRVTISGEGSTRISFTPAGNISRAGSLTVLSRYHQKRMVFSIGIGGVDIRD